MKKSVFTESRPSPGLWRHTKAGSVLTAAPSASPPCSPTTLSLHLISYNPVWHGAYVWAHCVHIDWCMARGETSACVIMCARVDWGTLRVLSNNMESIPCCQVGISRKGKKNHPQMQLTSRRIIISKIKKMGIKLFTRPNLPTRTTRAHTFTNTRTYTQMHLIFLTSTPYFVLTTCSTDLQAKTVNDVSYCGIVKSLHGHHSKTHYPSLQDVFTILQCTWHKLEILQLLKTKTLLMVQIIL